MTIDYEVIEVDYHRAEVAERIYSVLLRPVIEASVGGEPTPSRPPIVTWLTEPGTLITKASPISIKVEGEDLVLLSLLASFSGGATELIYRNGVFGSGYSDSEVVVDEGTYLFTLRRNLGWAGTGVRILVDAIDSSGQVPDV